jgi:hypothetical protein
MKKIFLFIFILIVISSCTLDSLEEQLESPKQIKIDKLNAQGRIHEQMDRSGDYGYPINMPTYLNWGDEVPGIIDNYHGGSYVSPRQSQDHASTNYGTCWVFAAVAAVESNYLITRPAGTSPIDIAELGVLSCCGSSECYWSGNGEDGGHPCNGGSVRHALNWLSSNPIPLEDTDCYPYSELTGTGYNGCTAPTCNESSNGYNCNHINYDFSHSGSLWNPSFSDIQTYLWKYGPIIGSFQNAPGYNADHVMLIYGYDTRGGAQELLIKDTSHEYDANNPIINYNINIGNPQYVTYLKDGSISDEFCENEDGDNYCWWGINAFSDYICQQPSGCDYEGCNWPEPDCFGGDSDISQCRFNCNDDGEWDPSTETDIYDEPFGGPGATCDPWESCSTCYDDCYIPPDGRSVEACAGDGICEGEENCITSPYDCAPCPECSDRIDNDGDGLIDYQGYELNGVDSDPDCDNFNDDDESFTPPPPPGCGNGILEGPEECDPPNPGQNIGVLCMDMVDNTCTRVIYNGEYEGVSWGGQCFYIRGDTSMYCSNSCRYETNWNGCEWCSAIEKPYWYDIRITDTLCQYRQPGGIWIDAPWKSFPLPSKPGTKYIPSDGGGDIPPLSPEEKGWWQTFISFFVDND